MHLLVTLRSEFDKWRVEHQRPPFIHQLIDANGWYAFDPRDEQERPELVPLVAFALMSRGRFRRYRWVVGLDRLLDPEYAPETGGQDCLVYLGDVPLDSDEGRERVEVAVSEMRTIDAELALADGSR